MQSYVNFKDGRIFGEKRNYVNNGGVSGDEISNLINSCVRYQRPVSGSRERGGHAPASTKAVNRGSYGKYFQSTLLSSSGSGKVVNGKVSEEENQAEDEGDSAGGGKTEIRLETTAEVVLYDAGERADYERREVEGYASEASFDGHRDYLTSSERIICGTTGTVRGMKNRVRAGIATFIHHSILNEAHQKDYGRLEKGRVVIYTTTNGIVRRTFQRCLRVNTILATMLVEFEERNVFVRKMYSRELKQRMLNVINSNEESHRHLHAQVDEVHKSYRLDDDDEGVDLVPQVFVDGRHLGGAARIEALNEVGILKRILKPYQRFGANRVCEMCGNYRLLLCGACNGSKKSFLCNRFTEAGRQVPLKCTNCDENGLVICHICRNNNN